MVDGSHSAMSFPDSVSVAVSYICPSVTESPDILGLNSARSSLCGASVLANVSTGPEYGVLIRTGWENISCGFRGLLRAALQGDSSLLKQSQPWML